MVASLLYLGVFGTVIGFVWYNEGIKAIGPARTAVFTNLVPVFAVALGALMLHEIDPDFDGAGRRAGDRRGVADQPLGVEKTWNRT